MPTVVKPTEVSESGDEWGIGVPDGTVKLPLEEIDRPAIAVKVYLGQRESHSVIANRVPNLLQHDLTLSVVNHLSSMLGVVGANALAFLHSLCVCVFLVSEGMMKR